MHRITGILAVVSSIFLALPALAEVVRFEIERHEPFADGMSFGEVGPYERIVGRVYFEVDPTLRQNREIVDLDLAPRNERGQVEFWSELFILAPRDLRQGSGAVLYDVNNRGNKLALGMFNHASRGNDPQTAAHAGNGFLMRNGFVIVWSGWDGELLPGDHRLRLAAPVAKQGDQPITGLVRCEIVPTRNLQRSSVVPWANHGSYRPTQRGIATATLTHRERAGDPRVPIPRSEWTLHVTEISSDAASPLPFLEIEVPAGLKHGHIYELIYEAQDPLVHGVCFASVRDLISALKHGTGKDNPLLVDGKSVLPRAHGFGVSQSGRFLREFLYSGFNEDEQGRKVFDGLMPHVAGAGLGSFNHRFAQPTRHVNQHDHHDFLADRFPFTYETETDPFTGQSDGILQRATETNTAPLVMHTQSAGEYWTRAGSLVHTDPLGEKDATLPENVRLYAFGGTQHGPSGFPPSRGEGRNLANPGDYKPFLRGLLLALDAWTRDGTPPPPSVSPTIQDGTLVDWPAEANPFPRIPGVPYPQIIHQPEWLDFGPRWRTERIIDQQPPKIRGHYRVRVPRSGPDGNDLGCLAPPEVAVPVATYTGWNLRRADASAEGELVTLGGSYIPFPITRTERERTGDPRPSLEERYGTLERYLHQLTVECQRLRDARYLTAEDAARIPRAQRERVAPLFEQIGR